VSEWNSLEANLVRHLGPVPAPDLLWERLHDRLRERRAPRKRELHWRLWTVAAMAIFVCCGAVAWHGAAVHDRQAELEALAGQEVGNTAAAEFCSSDAGKVRGWIKANAGVDVEIPQGGAMGSSSRVELLGARCVRQSGQRVAAVIYKVDGDPATLLIAKSSAGGSEHTGRSLAWGMRNQVYALAVSGTSDPHHACLLCHAI
jgi:hypothetical protein